MRSIRFVDMNLRVHRSTHLGLTFSAMSKELAGSSMLIAAAAAAT